MNKNFQFYKNRQANLCVTIPSREEVKLYLLYNNYLSEYSTEEELEIVLYNLGITQKLEILKNLIDVKVIEVGDILWDTVPTEGHIEHILSSDAIFNTLKKYYTKTEINDLFENFWERMISTNDPISIVVDSLLSDTSTNPVQNKVIKNALDSKVNLEGLEELIVTIVNRIVQGFSLKDEKSKGYYSSYQELVDNNPNSSIGDWAIVDLDGTWYIAKYGENGWIVILLTYDKQIDLNGYVKTETLEGYQEKLISGINIKVVNGESLLGPGNILIKGGIDEETLNNYYTKNETYNKDEIDGLIAKGHFKVVNTLPEEDIREDLIYLVPEETVFIPELSSNNPIKYILYVHDDTGWHNIGSTEIDLSDYLKKLVNQLNIKSVDGISLLITNPEDVNIDLSRFVTREELYNQLNPLKVSISVSPTLKEYTSEPYSINISVLAKKGNNNVSPCLYSITRTVNGSTTTIGSGTSTNYIDNISNAGTYRYSVTADYTETSENASSSATIYIVYPTYLGFSLEENISNIDLSEFSKELKTNLSMTKTLNNTISGSYLYIITPLSNPIVATDQGFTYKINMELVETLNNLKYYRSTSLIDICNLTYYIK